MVMHRFWGTFMDSFVSRKYQSCEAAGELVRRTHMAMMETKVERINILNEEKMRIASV